jgi:hypothetical protein
MTTLCKINRQAVYDFLTMVDYVALLYKVQFKCQFKLYYKLNLKRPLVSIIIEIIATFDDLSIITEIYGVH